MPRAESAPVRRSLFRSAALRGSALAPELLRVLRLHLRSRLLSEQEMPGRGSREDRAGESLVVTMTSIPSRLAGIVPALNSLLDQTIPPREILLALPEHSVRENRPYRVPEEIMGHPRIRILRTERDWGPATKIIPALLEYTDRPDQALLAVDDDNVYPPAYIETYLRWAAELPGAALSMRGAEVAPSLRWEDCVELNATAVEAPLPVDVVEGCAGILVRPSFFDVTFLDFGSAPPEAFFVDDIWTSGHLARRGVPTYLIPFDGALVYFPVLSTLRGPRLDRDENASGHNNHVMLDHFAASWGPR